MDTDRTANFYGTPLFLGTPIFFSIPFVFRYITKINAEVRNLNRGATRRGRDSKGLVDRKINTSGAKTDIAVIFFSVVSDQFSVVSFQSSSACLVAL